MEDIVLKVSSVTGVAVEDILSKRRTQEVCEAKQLLIYVAYNKHHVSRSQIAKYLRCTPQVISHHLIVFRNQLRLYKGSQLMLEKLEHELIMN